MKRVFKYEILLEDNFFILLPEDAQILTLQIQRGIPQIWVLVDPDKKLEKREFRLAGTGHSIKEENLSYIGSFQIFNESQIYHLFELTKNLLN